MYRVSVQESVVVRSMTSVVIIFSPMKERVDMHLNVENWLNDIEELLETAGCTEEQKLHALPSS
jgi:hypothetical protein